MLKQYINYKKLSLPAIIISSLLINACDNKEDNSTKAEASAQQYAQEAQKKAHEQSLFFYDKAEMKKAVDNIKAQGGPTLSIIEVKFSKDGYSFIRQSASDPNKVESYGFSNGKWGGPAPVELTILGSGGVTEEQRNNALKNALFRFDTIDFSVVPERIQEALKRANASGIASLTEDDDIVVTAGIEFSGEFAYKIIISPDESGQSKGYSIMTLNKDGSIANYETQKPYDPQEEVEKARQLTEQSKQDTNKRPPAMTQQMQDMQKKLQK